MRLQDKVAIISGAASGIGKATAERFAAEGAAVALADLLEAEGRAAAEAIVAAGGRARFYRLDVTDDAAWGDVVASVVAEHGQLDVLVNNAGVSGGGYEDVLDGAGWDRLMGINATGAFLGMKHAIPRMLERGRGSIVNLSSIAGNSGQPNLHLAYGASKGAVRIMSKAAAVHYGGLGIRINSIHPGLMPPMRSSAKAASPAYRAKLMQHIPLGRAGEVGEVANAILFLASDEASYITGAELHVDGGYLAA